MLIICVCTHIDISQFEFCYTGFVSSLQNRIQIIVKDYNKKMKVNDTNVRIIYPIQTLPQKHDDNGFTPILNELIQANAVYVNVFNDYNFKSDILSKKHASFLYTKICTFLDQGSTQSRNEKKQQFCYIFKSYIKKFLQEYLLLHLNKCYHDEEIVSCLVQKWEHFKKFIYFYVFLLKSADNHYEQSYKSYKNQGKTNKINNQDSIFPIPALAIYYFETLIYNNYKLQITRSIRYLICQQREGKTFEKQLLRSLFEIVYSCGLGQLARIAPVKGANNQSTFQFYPCQNKQIYKQYTNENKNPDINFFKNILNIVIEDCQAYYHQLFSQTISHFGPHEDFITVLQILCKQQQISQCYFFNYDQKNAYLNKIKQIIVVTNLQQRLTKQNSLKTLLQKFDYNSDQYLSQIKIFTDVIFKSQSQSIQVLQIVLKNYLIQSGAKINQKLNKRRQYMIEIVKLIKSINRVLEELMHKNLSLCRVRDRCFAKILDSIEASRSLAQFTDLRIKQCIKNKIGQSQFADKTAEIFLILKSLAATDTFLIYHQQLLSRRLLEPLNQPKLDVQKFILRKIGEKLGNVAITVHTNMIKDIQKSQQISQDFNKKLPFFRFKWNCRIINPTFWPENMYNVQFQMAFPQAMRIQAETISDLYHNQFNRYISWKIDKGYSLFEGTFKTGKFRYQSENIFLILLLHISEGKNKQIMFWELLKKVGKQNQNSSSHLQKCVNVLIDNGLIKRNDQSEHGGKLSINLNYQPPAGYKPAQPIIIKPSAQLHKALHETTVEHKKIMKEREKVVQAVLVKLLKHSHSTGNSYMTYEQLLKGVRENQYLKTFDISEVVVKQRLEDIIVRGYCQRSENDKRIFRYVA